MNSNAITIEITQSPRMIHHCHRTRSATCVHFIVRHSLHYHCSCPVTSRVDKSAIGSKPVVVRNTTNHLGARRYKTNPRTSRRIESGVITNRTKTYATSPIAISCGIQKSSRANDDCQIAYVASQDIGIHHVRKPKKRCIRDKVG